jgi:hypothetical protein
MSGRRRTRCGGRAAIRFAFPPETRILDGRVAWPSGHTHALRGSSLEYTHARRSARPRVLVRFPRHGVRGRRRHRSCERAGDRLHVDHVVPARHAGQRRRPAAAQRHVLGRRGLRAVAVVRRRCRRDGEVRQQRHRRVRWTRTDGRRERWRRGTRARYRALDSGRRRCPARRDRPRCSELVRLRRGVHGSDRGIERRDVRQRGAHRDLALQLPRCGRERDRR